MASIRVCYCSLGLKLAALILLMFTIRVKGNEETGGLQLQQLWRKPVLGSRPPQCANRCSGCNPCVAALVSPPKNYAATQSDESYYLLSWKCRCGNKFYKP